MIFLKIRLEKRFIVISKGSIEESHLCYIAALHSNLNCKDALMVLKKNWPDG
jgi:hypothetical protein